MHSKLRFDKTCQNCRYVVEKRFCTNCGQENTETRASFGYLLRHFVEDLVHYDSNFWKTIRYLLFKPGRLTKEYLSGKRVAFVPPVKLYIFINFLTFFLLSVLPFTSENEVITVNTENNKVENAAAKDEDERDLIFGDYLSVAELDKAQASLPEEERFGSMQYYFEKKLARFNEKYDSDNVRDDLYNSIITTIPKIIFLYMPFLALVLWLFHGKRRWFYFDHGIFTLHYFSFLLLTFSLVIILASIGSFINMDVLLLLADVLVFGWWIFYFFRSHRRFYDESKLVSRLKCIAMFFINVTLLIFFLLLGVVYSAMRLAS